MKRIVIDTNILIDYSKGFATWPEDLLIAKKRTTDLIIPTIVISEYFASSFLEEPKLRKAADDLFSLFHKVDFNEEIAKILAKILRRKTFPKSASLADLIIASTAIYLDAELATRNKSDFTKIPSLRIFEVKEKKSRK